MWINFSEVDLLSQYKQNGNTEVTEKLFLTQNCNTVNSIKFSENTCWFFVNSGKLTWMPLWRMDNLTFKNTFDLQNSAEKKKKKKIPGFTKQGQ